MNNNENRMFINCDNEERVNLTLITNYYPYQDNKIVFELESSCPVKSFCSEQRRDRYLEFLDSILIIEEPDLDSNDDLFFNNTFSLN